MTVKWAFGRTGASGNKRFPVSDRRPVAFVLLGRHKS